jgi:hypothetical protein
VAAVSHEHVVDQVGVAPAGALGAGPGDGLFGLGEPEGVAFMGFLPLPGWPAGGFRLGMEANVSPPGAVATLILGAKRDINNKAYCLVLIS